MTEKQIAERQMRALESIATSMKEMVKVGAATQQTLADIGKVLKAFQESDLTIKVDADQLDLPLETEELPLRWGQGGKQVGTAKVERDDVGNLMVTGKVTDPSVWAELQSDAGQFSLVEED